MAQQGQRNLARGSRMLDQREFDLPALGQAWMLGDLFQRRRDEIGALEQCEREIFGQRVDQMRLRAASLGPRVRSSSVRRNLFLASANAPSTGSTMLSLTIKAEHEAFSLFLKASSTWDGQSETHRPT